MANDVLSSELGSEHVLLNLRDGIYYGLEDVGSDIWKMLQKPVPVGDICGAIFETRDVDPERCRRDVLKLLDELVERHLVELRDPGWTGMTARVADVARDSGGTSEAAHRGVRPGHGITGRTSPAAVHCRATLCKPHGRSAVEQRVPNQRCRLGGRRHQLASARNNVPRRSAFGRVHAEAARTRAGIEDWRAASRSDVDRRACVGRMLGSGRDRDDSRSDGVCRSLC